MGVFAPTTDLEEIYMEGSPTYSSSNGQIFNLKICSHDICSYDFRFLFLQVVKTTDFDLL